MSLSDALSLKESELINRAMVVTKVVLPETIDDVPQAESSLKTLKKERSLIEVERKKITSRFDGVIDRLMRPEKEVDSVISSLSERIIKLKKEKQDFEMKEQCRQREVARITLFAEDSAIRTTEAIYMEMEQFLQKAYTYYLDNANPVDMDGIKRKFLNKITYNPPSIKSDLIEATEVDRIVEDSYRVDMEAVVRDLNDRLEIKFATIESDRLNKATAKAFAEKELEDSLILIKEKEEARIISNKIKAESGIAISLIDGIAPLKVSYEIDMDESVETVLLLMAAFASNKGACMKHLRVNKWFSFTPRQAAAALCKLKEDDSSFGFEGINFKEVNKL